MAQASKKITERRLIWYGHVMRRDGRYTREKEERTTENKMERPDWDRRVSTRFEKYWTESGRGDGQGDVEKKDHQSYRRPYMMGKARGKEEEEEFCIPMQCSCHWVFSFLYVTGLDQTNRSLLSVTVPQVPANQLSGHSGLHLFHGYKSKDRIVPSVSSGVFCMIHHKQLLHASVVIFSLLNLMSSEARFCTGPSAVCITECVEVFSPSFSDLLLNINVSILVSDQCHTPPPSGPHPFCWQPSVS